MKSLAQAIRLSLLCAPVVLLTACGGDDDNDREISNIEDRLDAIELRLDAIETNDIDSLETSIADIEMRLAELEADGETIAELQTMLDALEAQVAALEEAATTVYEVTLLNTTYSQPLSPPALVIHRDDYSAWSIGSEASPGLEDLAESGSPAAFIAEATSAVVTMAGDGVVMPGTSTTMELSAIWNPELELTVATMLVNTNDAFSGTSGWRIGQLAVGETVKLLAPIYDAGTETNDELSTSIPGPAAGGEGYNAAREEADQVTRHPGVVTQADGYAESALDESHKFDNGAVLITVKRTI